MKILFLLLVFVGHSFYANAQGRRQCDPVLLSACQNRFQTLTGIDLRGYWREVRRQVEDSYGGANDTNYRKVCRGFVEFQRCMAEYYYECIGVQYLVSNLSESTWDAYQTQSIYFQQHFVCGAGFPVFLANEECITNVWRTQRTQLDDYRGFFDVQVEAQLGNHDAQVFCALGNQLKINYQTVFQGLCTTIDASWWACEYSRINVISGFPFCSTAAYRCVQETRASPGTG